MACVWRKHVSKSLCHTPASLTNHETQLECLDFPKSWVAPANSSWHRRGDGGEMDRIWSAGGWLDAGGRRGGPFELCLHWKAHQVQVKNKNTRKYTKLMKCTPERTTEMKQLLQYLIIWLRCAGMRDRFKRGIKITTTNQRQCWDLKAAKAFDWNRRTWRHVITHGFPYH